MQQTSSDEPDAIGEGRHRKRSRWQGRQPERNATERTTPDVRRDPASSRRVLDAVVGTPDPEKKSKESEIQVAKRLRKHLHDPRFRALGERLEELRQKHEQGLLVSIEFLKSLLKLARDVVEAERTVEPATSEERGKNALTELFEETRNDRTHIMVERVVNDIDEIVRHVRFEGWQTTHAGEREVKNALRKTLFKYRLHQDQDVFKRAYGYIQEYYALPLRKAGTKVPSDSGSRK